MSAKKRNIDQFKEKEKSPTDRKLLRSESIKGQSSDNNTSNGALSEHKHVKEKFNMVKGEGLYYKQGHENAWKWIAGEIYCIELLVNKDGQTCYGRKFKLIDSDQKEQFIVVPIEWFTGDGRRVEEVLMKVNEFNHDKNRSSKRMLVEYLSQVKPHAKVPVYDKTGWSHGHFALPNGVIGDSKEYFVGDPDAAHYEHAGTLTHWQDIIKLSETNSRLVLALLTAFAAPLLEITRTDNFGIHLAGASSIGKTTALKLAASVFGSPERYPLTWRATSNALEGVATAHNDTLLILDEIGQASLELGNTVYMLFNGQGKSRLKRDCALRKMPTWRLIVLSSGEATLEEHIESMGGKSKAGHEVRCITINADAEQGEGILDDLQGIESGSKFIQILLDELNINYGLAGEMFIRALVKNRESIEQSIKERLRVHKQILLAETKKPAGQVSRVAEKFALLAYAGELAIEYGILPFSLEVPIQTCQRLFNEWLRARGGEGNLEEKQIFIYLQDQLELHTEKFHKDSNSYIRESWGCIRNDITYLTVAGMKNMFRDFSIPIVKKVLLKAKIICTDRPERKTIHTHSGRYFELNTGNLYKELAVIL